MSQEVKLMGLCALDTPSEQRRLETMRPGCKAYEQRNEHRSVSLRMKLHAGWIHSSSSLGTHKCTVPMQLEIQSRILGSLRSEQLLHPAFLARGPLICSFRLATSISCPCYTCKPASYQEDEGKPPSLPTFYPR